MHPVPSDTTGVLEKKVLVGFNMQLAALLDSIRNEDQTLRLKSRDLEKAGADPGEMKELWRTIRQKDSTNLIAVRGILDEYGWPSASVVGSGNNALFLVIQHSDLTTQERYLPMMRDAVMVGDANTSDLALLEDRVLIREGKRQIYGSQLDQDPITGAYYLCPLDDARHVDERRAAVGLEPIENYLKFWKLTWDAGAYERELPRMEEKLRKLALRPSTVTPCALDSSASDTKAAMLISLLHEGDLVFQDLDCGPLCDAIEKVTEGVDGKDLSHVAVAASVDGAIVLVEAIGGTVHTTAIHAFVERSAKIVVTRPRGVYAHIAPLAAATALTFLGVRYDDAFLPGTDKLYCSEVAAIAYERANGGVPVFPSGPMTFKDPTTGEFFPTWVTYYDELGIAIPEGVLGCNPGGLSRSDALLVIWSSY